MRNLNSNSLSKLPRRPMLKKPVNRVQRPSIDIVSERKEMFGGKFEWFQGTDVEDPNRGGVECSGDGHLFPSWMAYQNSSC